jgi:hypothetical protein
MSTVDCFSSSACSSKPHWIPCSNKTHYITCSLYVVLHTVISPIWLHRC